MIKELFIGAGVAVIFLIFLFYASQVVMIAWIKIIEKHFKNKSKEKQNEQEKK